jgi:hypothetical protein
MDRALEAPYPGLADALSAARVPDDIVRKFEIMREPAHRSSRDHERQHRHADRRRSFGRVASAMTVGDIVCFSTYPDPAERHAHAATYETVDDAGTRYAIMILALGGNVALLEEQSER